MPGGHQHRRVFARMIIWNIHERRDIQSRQTLENKFLNGVAVHGNLADDYWVQIGLCNGQTTNHFEEFLPKLILRLQQARFVADGVPGFLAGLVLLRPDSPADTRYRRRRHRRQAICECPRALELPSPSWKTAIQWPA